MAQSQAAGDGRLGWRHVHIPVSPAAWTVTEFLSSCHDVGRLATRLLAAAAALRPLTAGIGTLRRGGVRRR